jgi:hypothetical protein
MSGEIPSASDPRRARVANPAPADKLSPRSHGYFEATRSEDALALLRHYAPALTLAYVIGQRARWRNDGFNPHGLQFGEAFLGDFGSYGLTEREYRTAKKILAESQFATFKATNKGTIAKLIDTRLFRINPPKGDGQNAGQVTNGATNTTTTNLNLKAVKRESDKAFSTKASKLTVRQKELADRMEAALGDQWGNDAGKWIGRIKSAPGKCERVIAEVESARREKRIKTTPAPFAEDTWKRFAPCDATNHKPIAPR